MAEEAPAHVPSLRERMAALNLNQVALTPTTPPPSYHQTITQKKTKPSAPPLPKRPAVHRAESVNIPPAISNGIASSHEVGNQPAKGDTDGASSMVSPPGRARSRDTEEHKPSLPPRRPTADNLAAPSLPPRRPSGAPSLPSRKASQESVSSVVSCQSSVSGITSGRSSISAPSANGQPNGGKFRVRAPDYDPASLPPLPEKKRKDQKEDERPRTTLRSTISAPNVTARSNGCRQQSAANDVSRPALPARPALPSRPGTTNLDGTANGGADGTAQSRPRRSALDFAMNNPPPVPLSSRPDLAALQASKPKPSVNGASTCCLKCRDFSGPDSHAARFPRDSIPSTDINWLAQQLTAPFSSDTDKARAIFTWEHHNIRYDVDAFFGNRVQPSTPSSTIESGLAVCEGYAGLFSALAAAAGLESVVICGHGKGYGYDPANPPLHPTGHAWNAVRIDGGEWKLIDPCWGAGHIECEKKDPNRPYIKSFTPRMFTMSNEEFGERHYPEDDRYFFRQDGRRPTFQEYFAADQGPGKRQVYSDAEKLHGISERSVQPLCSQIRVDDPSAPTVRFQCERICRHWDPVRNGEGKPYLFVLKVNGVGGAQEEWVPLQTDGYFTWCDVPREKLGRPGQQVMLAYQRTCFNGRDGRGLTLEEYQRTRPTWTSWSWGGLAMWTLV